MQVYASDDLYVVYQPAPSDFLLITFNYHGMKADGASFWGSGLCQKLGIAALGFVSRESRWFPHEHVTPAIAAALPHIRQHTRRITYGSSMGAFGALKYGQALGAEAAIALSPQFSIDPDLVGSFETNFVEFFTSANKGMEIDGTRDLAERPYVFFDQGVPSDAEHVRRIAAASPQAEIVKMPHCGHAIGRAFASTAKGQELLRTVLDGSPADVRRFASQARRSSALRATLLSFKAFRSHPRWAADVTTRFAHFFEKQDRVLAANRMRAILQSTRTKLDQTQDAASREYLLETIQSAETALQAASGDARALLQKGFESLKAGDKEGAVALGREAVRLAPLLPLAHQQLAGWLMDKGDFVAAEQAARRAMALAPDEVAIILRHAVAAERSGQGAVALASMRAALRLAPDNTRALDQFSHMLQRQGHLEEALEAGRRLVALEPGNAAYQRRLSRLAFATKDIVAAHAAAERAVELDQNDAAAWGFVADLRRLRQDMDGAIQAITRALALASDEPRWHRQQESLLAARDLISQG